MTALSETVDTDTLLGRIQELEDHREQLEEDFRAAQILKYEDAGWKLITGQEMDNDDGPDLESLREMVAPQLRLLASANPLIKKVRLLRQSYVWSGTPHISGADAPSNGRPSNLYKFVSQPVNQENLFDSTAHEKMESALVTDGCYLLLGNKTSKQMRPVPLRQIVRIMVDPEFTDVIWAYKRQWDRWNARKKAMETVTAWYMTDRAPTNGLIDMPDEDPVDDKHTMLDFWVNKQVGWALGLPDALAAAPWAQMYVELMQNGRIMTDALAKFAAKVTNKTKAGHTNTGAKIANARGAGKVAALAQGNELEIFASAGKTYDFNGIRPVAAMVAAAGEVSLVHLLSDPGAAGGSYGGAANLDRPTKTAVKQRQDAWVVFLKRVIKWATRADVDVSFPPLDEENYRKTQQVALADKSGLFHRDEMRTAYAEAAGIKLTHAAAPPRPVTPSAADPSASTGVQAAAPDQGRSSGAGKVDSTVANDQRTDTIS
jgi:hypothetical protein